MEKYLNKNVRFQCLNGNNVQFQVKKGYKTVFINGSEILLNDSTLNLIGTPHIGQCNLLLDPSTGLPSPCVAINVANTWKTSATLTVSGKKALNSSCSVSCFRQGIIQPFKPTLLSINVDNDVLINVEDNENTNCNDSCNHAENKNDVNCNDSYKSNAEKNTMFYVMESSNNVKDFDVFLKNFRNPCVMSEFQHLDKKAIYIDTNNEFYQDFIYTHGIPLISEKVKDYFDSKKVDYLFYKKIIFQNLDTGKRENYWLALPPRINCLNRQKSDIDELLNVADKICINPTCIGRYHIFKLAGVTNLEIILNDKSRVRKRF